MAKQRLFPGKTITNEGDTAHERFTALASTVVSASRHAVDEREREWKKGRDTQRAKTRQALRP